jgi:hypothetical protein
MVCAVSLNSRASSVLGRHVPAQSFADEIQLDKGADFCHLGLLEIKSSGVHGMGSTPIPDIH